MSCKKWRPKTGMAIPNCLCWKLLHTRSDENIQTYLICLQICNMQKHQKANFRTAEYVCTTMMVESEHNTFFMTCHIMKHAVHFQLAQGQQREPGKTLLLYKAKHCLCRDLNTRVAILFLKMH